MKVSLSVNTDVDESLSKEDSPFTESKHLPHLRSTSSLQFFKDGRNSSRSMTLAQIVGDSKTSVRQYLETWEVCRMTCKALYGNISSSQHQRVSSVMSALIEKMKKRTSLGSLLIGGEIPLTRIEGSMVTIIAVEACKIRL